MILLRLGLQIESAVQQRDWMEVERIAKELRKTLDAASGREEVSSQHVYQEGWDRLAQYKLFTGEQSDTYTAVEWFVEKVIEKRKYTIKNGRPGIWLRPPDKLAVFHYARVLLYNEEGGMTEIFREQLDKRPLFKTIIHEEFMNMPYLKEDEKWWYENTLLGPEWEREEVWDHIKKLQEHGWRY